jgi:hypothetical protein
MLRQVVATKVAFGATNTNRTATDNWAEGEVFGESLRTRVNRAKARWLKRVMYQTPASSTGKCFAYSVVDHLNCSRWIAGPAHDGLHSSLAANAPRRLSARHANFSDWVC